jgi:uncharacterized protein (DUF427 family)
MGDLPGSSAGGRLVSMTTESVWDYPRPPRVEADPREVVVTHHGVVLGRTIDALRVLETSHPPAYYLPPVDVRTDLLLPTSRQTYCEWKGVAHYVDLALPDATVPFVAWFYPEPDPGFEVITDYFAFYPALVEECLVDGERVTPQDSDFYGGWITSNIVGPFKKERTA